MRCEKGTISMQAIINHEVPFNVPPCVGDEIGYVQEAIEANRKICGDGPFTKKCNEWLENRFSSNKVLLTTSGTSALEMAAILCDLNRVMRLFCPRSPLRLPPPPLCLLVRSSCLWIFVQTR